MSFVSHIFERFNATHFILYGYLSGLIGHSSLQHDTPVIVPASYRRPVLPTDAMLRQDSNICKILYIGLLIRCKLKATLLGPIGQGCGTTQMSIQPGKKMPRTDQPNCLRFNKIPVRNGDAVRLAAGWNQRTEVGWELACVGQG